MIIDPQITIRGEHIEELRRRLREARGLPAEAADTTNIADENEKDESDGAEASSGVWDEEYLKRLKNGPLSPSAREFMKAISNWRASGPHSRVIATAGVTLKRPAPAANDLLELRHDI